MPKRRVGGLILAAGKSERMGQPKSLLQIYGRTFLEQIVKEAGASLLVGVKIILGHEAHAVLRRLPKLPAEVILNSVYMSGQLSSFICGIQSWSSQDLDGLMLLLVDHPLVTREIIDQLIHGFEEKGNPIVIPTYRGRRGHPVIFSRELFPEILQAPIDQGAAAVVKKYSGSVLDLECLSPAILVDIDTPEAYQQHIVLKGIQSIRGTIP